MKDNQHEVQSATDPQRVEVDEEKTHLDRVRLHYRISLQVPVGEDLGIHEVDVAVEVEVFVAVNERCDRILRGSSEVNPAKKSIPVRKVITIAWPVKLRASPAASR